MRLLKNQVFKNFGYLTLGNTVSQIVGVVALIKIANIFSPADYGVFTFMLVQSQLLIAIGDLGMQRIVVRTIARNPNKTKEILRTGLVLKISAVLLLSSGYVAYNHFFGSFSSNQLILVFLFSIINCGMNLFDSAFIGHQKMLFPAIIKSGASFMWLLAIFIIPWHLMTINLLFLVYFILHLIKTFTLYIILKSKGLIVGDGSPFLPSSKELMQQSWPYLSLILFLIPVNFLSNNFLDINSTAEEIGYFNLSQRIIQPVNVLIGFALTSIFPNISALWAKDEAKFNYALSKGFKVFFFVSLALAVLFSLFAKELIILLFPVSYLPAIKVAQLQIWFVFLMSINSFIGAIFGATNKEVLVFKTSLVNGIIATPMLYFGSKYGALGIAFAYVISFAIFEIYLWLVFMKNTNITFTNALPIWLVAIAAFAISTYVLASQPLGLKILFVGILISITAFFFGKKIMKNLRYVKS